MIDLKKELQVLKRKNDESEDAVKKANFLQH